MHILFITHYAGFYGANKSLLTLMCYLRTHYKIEPIVLLPSKGIFSKYLEEEYIPYIIQHYYWWVNDNHGAFQYLLNKCKQFRNIFKVSKICKRLRDYNIDLVYSNSVTVNIGMFVAKQMGVPHIWHFREALTQFRLSLSLSISRCLLHQSQNAKFVLISDYMMRFYQSYLPSERMQRIYNGISLPINRERVSTNQLNVRLKVAIVGVVSKQKNQLELLKAQFQLLQLGIEIDTYIVGTYKEDYLAEIRKFVQDANLSDLVHIIGHADDVFGILQEMNVGVVCATDEAFGRTTIEFMLMKMPVVVSDSGANPELIRNEQDGYIYTSGDVNALAEVLKRYVEQPELLQAQGESAYQYAIDNFSAEKNAEAIYKVINEVMNE